MKYVIEIKENGNTTFPKSSHDISELKEWIHKNYPTAYQLPVLSSEVFGQWYVCKYSTHFTKNKYSEEAIMIYIKRSF